jgi:hypothetical protein
MAAEGQDTSPSFQYVDGDSKSQAAPPDVEKAGFPQNTDELSAEHRQYLLSVHGTIELDPIPSMDPADPLNWPALKVGLDKQKGVQAVTLAETYKSCTYRFSGIYDHLHSCRHHPGL